jgi:hypothetical protein
MHTEGRWTRDEDGEFDYEQEWDLSGTMRSGVIYAYEGAVLPPVPAPADMELLGTPRSGQRGVVHDSVRYGKHESRLEVQVAILAKNAEEARLLAEARLSTRTA